MSTIVPAVVLAAGRSSRMGQPKALLPTDRPGETFITQIVRGLTDGGAADVVVVVSAEVAAEVEGQLDRSRLAGRVAINPTPDRGQLSSLLVGLGRADRPGVSGLLMTLVDVPLIDADTVRLLLEAHARSRPPLVRPARGGRHGHPVLFDRALFDELRAADPARGAKPVVRAHLDRAVEVSVEPLGPFVDVDTPEEYQRVFGRPVPPAR